MKIIKPGLLTTIQDIGRPKKMHLGISHSGAMDTLSMRLANWLVGKPLASAIIEITLIGPIVEFQNDVSIAITGADFDLYLNGDLIFTNQTVHVKSGDKLEFDQLNKGARAYLAVAADFNIKACYQSYSTHLIAGFGGYQGRELAINDNIELTNCRQTKTKTLPEQLTFNFSGSYFLRCCESVESQQFNDKDKKIFNEQQFLVSPESNRMGIRLKGEPINRSKIPSITSSGLTQGSIQIPPSGLPIISSVDGQTIGGYPRIANIISADLPLLGQIKAGDKIRFAMIDMALAHSILMQQMGMFEELLR